MGWLQRKTKKAIAVVAAALLLAGAALAGCASTDDRESGEEHADREQGEHGSGEGREGSGERGSGDGEHGAGGEGSGEGGEGGSGELNEAEMSSPITPLNESWTGNLGGLEVDAWFEESSQTTYTTVRNTTDRTLCYVQSEPHLKSGTRTVGELGPDKLGDLAPGQETMSVVAVSSEPAMAAVSFDGYVVHLEIFDCAGPGPIPHSGEGAEGSGGESGGEHASGEASERGGEGSSTAALGPDDTYDETRNGARLILSYDAASNAFTGTVENTTDRVLTRARVEIHLSNGTELGPTTPTDLAPGQVLQIRLASTEAPFLSWTTHAEIGSGEG